MDPTIEIALWVGQGPLFRFAIALALFGLARALLLRLSDAVGAWVSMPDRSEFRRRLRLRWVWWLAPTTILARAGHLPTVASRSYHALLMLVGIVFRVTAVLVPVFMVAHVTLWERGLGLAWPTLPVRLADRLSIVVLVSGFVLFLGRLYSPVLRGIESPWSFLNPLLVLIPFGTGVLARHPAWCPVDYYVMMVLHTYSAAFILALLPFIRPLATVHTPLVRVVPDVAWQPEPAPPVTATA
ncbi:MAG: hypothetical protein IPM18_11675 [Phycisphaerales bacterium]|nr:hypothetical protein [Phycisphaerales bacterium]